MQERAIRTRGAILSAAMEAFSARGFAGTTIDEIAAAGEVNKQRIYAYFGSKQQLFEAVLLDCFSRVELFSADTLAAVAAAPERMTELLLANFLAVHEANPHFWRLLSWANLEATVSLDRLDGARRRDDTQLRSIFEAAVAAGKLRALSFDSYLFTLLAVSYFYHANRRTLQHTVGGALFNAEGGERLRRELDGLFRA